jgi:hypothetical protein
MDSPRSIWTNFAVFLLRLAITIAYFELKGLEPCGLVFLTSVGIGFLRKCRFLVGIGRGFGFRFFRVFF